MEMQPAIIVDVAADAILQHQHEADVGTKDAGDPPADPVQGLGLGERLGLDGGAEVHGDGVAGAGFHDGVESSVGLHGLAEVAPRRRAPVLGREGSEGREPRPEAGAGRPGGLLVDLWERCVQVDEGKGVLPLIDWTTRLEGLEAILGEPMKGLGERGVPHGRDRAGSIYGSVNFGCSDDLAVDLVEESVQVNLRLRLSVRHEAREHGRGLGRRKARRVEAREVGIDLVEDCPRRSVGRHTEPFQGARDRAGRMAERWRLG